MAFMWLNITRELSMVKHCGYFTKSVFLRAVGELGAPTSRVAPSLPASSEMPAVPAMDRSAADVQPDDGLLSYYSLSLNAYSQAVLS
jgi:hypothetical protein